MSKLMISLFFAAGLGFAGSGMAQTNAPNATPTPAPKVSYNDNVAAKGKGDAYEQRAAAIAKCDAYTGPEKAACVSEASPQDNSINKCDRLAGPVKDKCLKDLKSEEVKP